MERAAVFPSFRAAAHRRRIILAVGCCPRTTLDCECGILCRDRIAPDLPIRWKAAFVQSLCLVHVIARIRLPCAVLCVRDAHVLQA